MKQQMTDYDADEIVPQRKRKDRVPLIDKALGATGIVLAGLATFFPWYAFLNQEKFSLPTLWQGSSKEIPGHTGQPGLAASPLAMTDPQTRAAVDQLVTATVPATGEDLQPATSQDGPGQPFPAASGFRLMHVANGRALVEDKNGLYIVNVGGVLPDNSRLSTLEQRDGRWVMITSKGDLIQAD
ncbi:hypothetical protein QO002_001287 [Pararhizobium capsulatum DSM 1112]|uniref:Flagellar protein n=1 Tax=Pararhizobium capsulatum DSM 1112 TaxID=1121113 RepID=A0ABU0BN48_9HYPH|nr:flagellar protein [Pararhizobium capsulatum]MDQ0319149.1 hypothetical protein [Pararhizobium capsulatum DSM 1112]